MSEWTFVTAAYAAAWIVFVSYYLKLSRDARRARDHQAAASSARTGR